MFTLGTTQIQLLNNYFLIATVSYYISLDLCRFWIPPPNWPLNLQPDVILYDVGYAISFSRSILSWPKYYTFCVHSSCPFTSSLFAVHANATCLTINMNKLERICSWGLVITRTAATHTNHFLKEVIVLLFLSASLHNVPWSLTSHFLCLVALYLPDDFYMYFFLRLLQKQKVEHYVANGCVAWIYSEGAWSFIYFKT